ncbi:hypothetical protein PVK06_038227 [Gossypium arboreum]|uniref:Reverse transcriptase zinc-binding domain-containing protein n=1 Tax=Gossypium arboreum TaxID=29729 RepID=A0ABR0MZI0_GOSAR|nr:hypothetical protein PVK06_038227 [Gossypium arboreum]
MDKVSELIDQSTKTWKLDLISSRFTPLEVKTICCIPLLVYTSGDKLVWFADNSDMYTVRSGYRCLINLHINDSMDTDYTDFYKKIWGLNLSPKIRIAIWRFTKEFIPTTVNLFNRRINQSPICFSCGEVPKNFMHTLLICGLAKNVWQSIGVDWSNVNVNMDFYTWLKLVFQNSRHDFSEIAATAAWALW